MKRQMNNVRIGSECERKTEPKGGSVTINATETAQSITWRLLDQTLRLMQWKKMEKKKSSICKMIHI